MSPEDGSGSHSEGRICGDLVDQLGPRELGAALMEQTQLFRRLRKADEGEMAAETSEQLSLLDRLGPVCDTHSSLSTGKQRRAQVCSATVDKMMEGLSHCR